MDENSQNPFPNNTPLFPHVVVEGNVAGEDIVMNENQIPFPNDQHEPQAQAQANPEDDDDADFDESEILSELIASLQLLLDDKNAQRLEGDALHVGQKFFRYLYQVEVHQVPEQPQAEVGPLQMQLGALPDPQPAAVVDPRLENEAQMQRGEASDKTLNDQLPNSAPHLEPVPGQHILLDDDTQLENITLPVNPYKSTAGSEEQMEQHSLSEPTPGPSGSCCSTILKRISSGSPPKKIGRLSSQANAILSPRRNEEEHDDDDDVLRRKKIRPQCVRQEHISRYQSWKMEEYVKYSKGSQDSGHFESMDVEEDSD